MTRPEKPRRSAKSGFDPFRLAEHGTNFRIETFAGVTTFLTMSYIIFLQPAILSGKMTGAPTNMDADAVMVATCLAAALATALMGLLANLPIAQAPGMGQNFFFTVTVIPAAAAVAAVRGSEPWQVALGAVFLAGVIFLILTLLGARRMILRAFSPSLRNAIAVGIGLFIALIGLKNAGILVPDVKTDQGWLLTKHLATPDMAAFLFGLLVTAGLHARRIRGSILWGIVATTALCYAFRMMTPLLPESVTGSSWLAQSQLMTWFQPAEAVFAAPPSIAPVFLKMDVIGAFCWQLAPMILVLVFMDVFDTLGTLIGVSEQAGLTRDGEIPRPGRAMMSDAIGTVAGAGLGTSTVTSYIESAAGVQQGGRTGLTALIVAALFLIAPIAAPIIQMVGSYPAITAPALVIVAVMMMRCVTNIDWNDFTEAFPATLIIAGIPLTFSIADGLALGLFVYPIVKLLGGKWRSMSRSALIVTGILALLIASYFVWIRPMTLPPVKGETQTTSVETE